jgi:hypothetical protein
MEASWTRSESKKLKRDPLIVQAQVDYKTTWSNRSQATLELVDIRQPDFHDKSTTSAAFTHQACSAGSAHQLQARRSPHSKLKEVGDERAELASAQVTRIDHD